MYATHLYLGTWIVLVLASWVQKYQYLNDKARNSPPRPKQRPASSLHLPTNVNLHEFYSPTFSPLFRLMISLYTFRCHFMSRGLGLPGLLFLGCLGHRRWAVQWGGPFLQGPIGLILEYWRCAELGRGVPWCTKLPSFSQRCRVEGIFQDLENETTYERKRKNSHKISLETNKSLPEVILRSNCLLNCLTR